MADSGQDRKLPASQRKIKKAREDGQVARSRDLGHFAALAGAVVLTVSLAPMGLKACRDLLHDGLRFGADHLQSARGMQDHALGLVLQMLWILLPVGGLALATALGGSLLAGGWNFTTKALQPDFSKIDPISGLGRMFSGQQLAATLKACLLAVLLGVAGAAYLWTHWREAAGLLTQPLEAGLAQGGTLLQDGLALLCLVLGLAALIDVPFQRFMLMRRLRMTIEEAKQEHKEQEGNAEVKGALRRRMREMANKRMMAQVPLADLVVMNPTHYAVALKYDEATMSAPRVVAKGADLVAFRIRDLARESGVPVLEAPPLARALYAHTEVDQEVPVRLFSAVAQVLAWVFQLREGVLRGRAAEPPQPEVPADMDPHNTRPTPAAP